MNYTDTDRQAFTRIRDAIINWRDATIDLASVISEAKERQIWKPKYDSWSDFCQMECGITKRWANKLVLANKTMLKIANSETRNSLQNRETGGNDVPTLAVSVAAATELSKVPEDDRQAVLENASAAGTVTAKTITAAAVEKKPAQKAVELDKEGFPIPDGILALWQRAESEARTAMSIISKLRTALHDAEEEKDVIYREFRMQDNIGLLTSVFEAFKSVVPHGVCTQCQGKLPKGCADCKGRGFVSALYYKMHSDDRIKAIRTKMMLKK